MPDLSLSDVCITKSSRLQVFLWQDGAGEAAFSSRRWKANFCITSVSCVASVLGSDITPVMMLHACNKPLHSFATRSTFGFTPSLSWHHSFLKIPYTQSFFLPDIVNVNGGFIVEDRTCVNDCTIYCGVFEIIRNKIKKNSEMQKLLQLSTGSVQVQ